MRVQFVRCCIFVGIIAINLCVCSLCVVVFFVGVVVHFFSVRSVPFRYVPFIFARSCCVGIIAINLCVCSSCVVVFLLALL